MGNQQNTGRQPQTSTTQQGGQIMTSIQLRDPSKLDRLPTAEPGQVKGLEHSFHARSDDDASVIQIWGSQQAFNEAMKSQYGKLFQQALGDEYQPEIREVTSSTSQ